MAAGDPLGIGITALTSFQRALGVTSNNVANVNTEGYNRQTIELSTRVPQFTGSGFIGSGVAITDIRRAYSDVLTEELRNATSLSGQAATYYKFAKEIDDLVANPDAGISPVLQNFFNAVNDVANEPTSIPARQVLLSQAQELTDRFVRFQDRFTKINHSVNQELEASVNDINSLTRAVARLNESIVVATGVGNGNIPNDLLDQRDQLLKKLSEHVAISVVEESDGSTNVFMGKGQLIVNRFKNQELTLVNNEYDPEQSEVAFTQNGVTSEISNQISGGRLGGALTFRDEVLKTSEGALGRVAYALAVGFNGQHNLGMDLTGTLGTDFFQEPQPIVLASASNTGTADFSVSISDVATLGTSDYRFSYNGSNQYTLLRLADNKKTNIDASIGYPFTSATIDGLSITINSAPTAGNSYLVKPTSRNPGNMDLLIEDPSQVAAAAPVRATVNLANTGKVDFNTVSITSTTSYLPGSYNVTFADSTTAVTNATAGSPVEAVDADATLQYELRINNISIHTQGEGAVPLTLAALTTAINAQTTNSGVRAYLDAGANRIYLANNPPSALSITVNESLVATTGALEAGDSVTGYFGSALTDATTSNAIVYTPSANSYVVLDGAGSTVTSGAYTAGNNIDFNGIRIQAKGTPNLGDAIAVNQNTGGVGDNRNALALASLRNATSIANNTTTYQEAYGQLVASVGTSTNQAEVNARAQTTLMRTTQDERDGLSGVNLDEEAANILRYQQAYQAAAKIIATADSLFQTLLQTMGR